MSVISLVSEQELEYLINDLARGIAIDHEPASRLALVGVRTHGVPLAQRLAQRLRDDHGIVPLVGAVDVTLYRDDLDQTGRWPILRGTEIPFVVEGAEIVLVDDVLFTGRTIRAALNALCDLGRPARVRLLVLVDRGGRELPIQADLVGIVREIEPRERIEVHLRPIDSIDEVVLVTE